MTKNFRGKRIFLLTGGAVLIGMIALFWQMSSIISQTKPLTIAQIYTVLNSGKDENGKKWTIAERNKRAVEGVKKVGVNFPLTKENESGLREAGATDELIDAIRQNSPRLPTPTRTPIIKSTPTVSGKEIKNSIGMEFVKIPAGEFMMGSNDSEIDEAVFERKKYYADANRSNFADETPKHKVTIGYEFYLGKYEVTQGQWQAIMGDNPSKFTDCGANCPVEQVSWDDIQVFLKRLNSRDTQFEYRLPTEAEWEYAARAGTTTAFSFGDSLNSSQANFDGNYPYASTKGNYIGKTVKVGNYSPNGFGLYDMHGNVWEWVQDIYNTSYSNLRTDGSANLSVGDSSFRVLRGGSWFDLGNYCRSAVRYRFAPANRYVSVGFRLAARAK